MNRSRLAALSAGAMFLVASVFTPAVATADTGNTNTIKVLGAPTYNPPVASGTFTVQVVANGAEDISGAGTGLTFDNTKLQLTAIAKDATIVANGGAYAGWPAAGAPTTTFIANANAAGAIPVLAWSFTDGASFEPANADRGIFSATFSVIATGDSTIGVATGLNGGILSGTTANYGNPLTVTPQNGVVHNSFQPAWTVSAPGTATAFAPANGTSTDVTVTLAVTQGNPGDISFTASGAGVVSGAPTATQVGYGFSAATVTTGATGTYSTTLSLLPGDNVPSGTIPVTITATDGASVVHTAVVQLTIVRNDDFGISASPSSLSVNGGATSSAVNISTSVLNGTPGTITLSASGLPTGVTAAFGAPTVAAGSATTVTFTADATAVNGSATITISGQNALYTHTATISLNVIVISGVGQSVNVTGTLDAGFLGLTCPTSLNIGLIRGNTNQLNVPCQVYTNTVWNLNVSDPKATDKGHMTTGTPHYVMPDSMHVLSRSFISGGDVFYGNNVDLTDGSGTSCSVLQQPCLPANQQPVSGGTILSGTSSASAPLVLSQYVAPNTQPGSYGMQILFQAVSVF